MWLRFCNLFPGGPLIATALLRLDSDRPIRRIGLVVLGLLCSLSTEAQTGLSPSPGAAGSAMAGTGLYLRDIQSAFRNPAGLAWLSHFEATAFMQNRFLVEELQSLSAAAGLPLFGGGAALVLHHFGFEGYREQQFSLAYARQLNARFSIGGQFFGHLVQIPEYGSRLLWTGTLGFQAQLGSPLYLGGRVYNPFRLSLTENEYLPTSFALGLMYAPSDILQLILEVEKEIDFPEQIKIGLSYRISSALCLRAGLGTSPASFSFGISLSPSDRFQFDLAMQHHPFLGYSPSGGFHYRGSRESTH